MADKRTLLFVEGEPNSPNGDLRMGMEHLLSKKLKGKMPKIIIGAGYSQGGKSQTINKFKTNKIDSKQTLVLVDLDGPESERVTDLESQNLLDRKDDVFYMVQEMESWFLSQPEMLNKYYGIDNNKKNISDKLPKKPPSEIANPDKVLKKITKNTQKGEYHKIKHAVELLKRLDADKLEKDFVDFKRLIERIK